jgi:hypothetical protein
VTTEARSVPIPLAPTDRWAYLCAHFPLSADEWDQLMRVLDAMKPAIVEAAAEAGAGAGAEETG